MISNLDIYEHSPIPKNWADWDDMMDDNEPLLPDNEKIIKNKKKSSFPDGSSIEVVEYDLIEYFLESLVKLQSFDTTVDMITHSIKNIMFFYK